MMYLCEQVQGPVQVSLGADGQGSKGCLGLSLAGPASKAQGEAMLGFSRPGTQLLHYLRQCLPSEYLSCENEQRAPCLRSKRVLGSRIGDVLGE